MTTKPPVGPSKPLEGVGINPGPDLATTMALAALRRDSVPQAILKLWPRNSLD